MDKIYQDIFNNICYYLSLKDIAKLKKTNRIIRNYVYNFENILLSVELNKNENDLYMTSYDKKQYFYNFILEILNVFYTRNKHIINLDKKIYNFHYNYFFENQCLNNMTIDIFYHYINSNYNIKDYPNSFDLILISKFIYLYYFRDNLTIESCFNFLQNFNNGNKTPSMFQDIIIDYYIYTLKCIHDRTKYIFNTFEKIYIMSPYVINISCLKKIFSYKVLDLSKTKLIYCCEEQQCIVENLYEICDIKNAYSHDDLISHNYMQVKYFLYNQCLDYYSILFNRETYLINEKIFIKNPNTNRRMRINGSLYKSVMFSLYSHINSNESSNKKIYKQLYGNIINDIWYKQNYLRRRLFS